MKSYQDVMEFLILFLSSMTENPIQKLPCTVKNPVPPGKSKEGNGRGRVLQTVLYSPARTAAIICAARGFGRATTEVYPHCQLPKINAAQP